MSLVLFLLFFPLYLFTAAPHLAPYRDAGEMVSLLSTLGVAHPPGYPLYTLMGRIFTSIPLGNICYRANIFSAICAALALVFFSMTLRQWLGRFSSVMAGVFLGFSFPFWDLATVSEMYSLGALFFCALTYVVFRKKDPVLFSFLMALGLGVRMDMLLLIPFFIAWFWLHGVRREFSYMAAFFFVGSSVFLYLMFRSQSNPVIDWANPDNLLAVLNSARRKNYSGTLDLLSLSYQSGENFLINLHLYGAHVVRVFGWWGCLLMLAGILQGWKLARKPMMMFLLLLAVTSPLFLYLANMPPNPHALAIVEASYLMPDILLAIFIGFGVESIFKNVSNAVLKIVTPTKVGVQLCFVMIGFAIAFFSSLNFYAGYSRCNKRDNLYARDYVENVWRSIPENAVAVFQKDVQLFSLWQSQLVEKRRPDVSLVPYGLSASPWYWEMKRRWPTALSPEISLKEMGGYRRLKESIGGRPLLVGYDAEMSDRVGLKLIPHGMATLVEMDKGGNPKTIHEKGFILSHLCLYRGGYVYGETPDFFSTDLIGDHARAHHQQGFYLMSSNEFDRADWFYQRSEFMDPNFARSSSDRGYIAYLQKNVLKAYELYSKAVRKADRTIQLAIQYKGLPELLNGCRSEASELNTQCGAMAERLGRIDEARNYYLRALGIQENPQAHYNLAVSYWGKDWNLVISHMRRALELNPQMQEAQNFLAKAMILSGRK